LPASGAYGPIYTVIDYDDTVPTPITNLVSYQSLMVTQPGEYFDRVYTPAINLGAVDGTGAVTTARAQVKRQWLDIAVNTTPQLGLKYAIPNATTATNVWNTTVTCVFQFKDVR